MSKKIEIKLPNSAPPISHFCDAVQHGNVLYISGKTSRNDKGEVIHVGDATNQTRRILEQIKMILDHCNATFHNIVKVTVYLTNIDDREKVNIARKEYFGDSYPASTLFEVNKLVHPDMLVEIEAIAHLD